MGDSIFRVACDDVRFQMAALILNKIFNIFKFSVVLLLRDLVIEIIYKDKY